MDHIVRTKNGSLRGEQRNGYVQFLGVPFAKAPVGELRFRRPQPVATWEGTRDAKMYGNFCFQPGNGDTSCKTLTPSEDCLYLNIYTPACDDKRRPVVVWIHGGAYLTGSNSNHTKDGGLMCVRNDIVVVPIQYRLGALGCVDFSLLSGANGSFDSNCGTWDQVEAVNWVIKNIESFGGDPNNITLMGESAGACSVLILMTTPYLKGKIKRAVMDSPAPHLIHTKENGYIAAKKVAEHLGVTEEEAWKIADIDAVTLTKAVAEVEYNYVTDYPFLIPTAPVVDGDLIPELPYDAVMHGAADGIDVMIGTTKDEATLFARNSNRDIFPATRENMDKFFTEHPQLDRKRIMGLYSGKKKRKIWQEIGKEVFFHLPSLELADHLAKHGTVYVHHFDYVYPMLKLLGLGAVHCTNSTLISGGKPEGLIKFLGLFSGEKGAKMQEYIHGYWCNFISSGDPNGDELPEWPEYGVNRNTFFLDIPCHVEQDPFGIIRDAFGEVRLYGN